MAPSLRKPDNKSCIPNFDKIILNPAIIYILNNNIIMNFLKRFAKKDIIEKKQYVKLYTLPCKKKRRKKKILAIDKDAIIIGKINYDDIEFEMCCNFVMYQIYKYNSSDSLKRCGFIVGSPLHGSIESSEIIFIGPNPAIDTKCFFPRIHPDEKLTYCGRYPSEQQVRYRGSTVNNIISDCNQLESFFQERLVKSYDESQRKIYTWIINDDLTLAQSKEEQITWRGMIDYAKKILSYEEGEVVSKILSIDIIPFGSANSYGVKDEYLEFCWNNYIRDIICKSKVRNIVILEQNVVKMLCKILHAEAGLSNKLIKEGEAVTLKIQEEEFNIIYLYHPSYIARQTRQKKAENSPDSKKKQTASELREKIKQHNEKAIKNLKNLLRFQLVVAALTGARGQGRRAAPLRGRHPVQAGATAGARPQGYRAGSRRRAGGGASGRAAAAAISRLLTRLKFS